MQVMIELVINHTSDQHPWFQAARNAPKGSPERDMYVWSDTDKLYDGVRIIFTDTEKSNWTWDEVARSVLLASLLLASAGSQLRQPRRYGKSHRSDALLARHGRGCPAHGRDSLPGRARRHLLRERSRDSRQDQGNARRHRRRICQPGGAGRGQHVAGRRPSLLRGRRRMPHGLPLPADASHLHGDPPGRSASHHRHHGPDPRHPGQLPVGHLPAQPR